MQFDFNGNRIVINEKTFSKNNVDFGQIEFQFFLAIHFLKAIEIPS